MNSLLIATLSALLIISTCSCARSKSVIEKASNPTPSAPPPGCIPNQEAADSIEAAIQNLDHAILQVETDIDVVTRKIKGLENALQKVKQPKARAAILVTLDSRRQELEVLELYRANLVGMKIDLQDEQAAALCQEVAQ